MEKDTLANRIGKVWRPLRAKMKSVPDLVQWKTWGRGTPSAVASATLQAGGGVVLVFLFYWFRGAQREPPSMPDAHNG